MAEPDTDQLEFEARVDGITDDLCELADDTQCGFVFVIERNGGVAVVSNLRADFCKQLLAEFMERGCGGKPWRTGTN